MIMWTLVSAQHFSGMVRIKLEWEIGNLLLLEING